MNELIAWLPSELATLPRYVVALAIGLLMGLERERNPAAKAGLRTFALTALFGVPEECVKTVQRDDLRAYVFRGKDRAVAIAWCGAEQSRALTLAAAVRAYDIMGNGIPARDATLSDSPVYLVSAGAEPIIQSLAR